MIKDGDMVHIDIPSRKLTVDVSDEEFENRKMNWKPVEKPALGWLKLYKNNCTSAQQFIGTDILRRQMGNVP